MAYQCQACKTRVKDWEGDDATCAFAAGEWSASNWNCATMGMIRDLFGEPYTSPVLHDGIFHQREDDENAGMICTVGIDLENSPISLWVNWYKNRGKTAQMWLLYDSGPPRRPTEEELVQIAKHYANMGDAE